MSCWPPMRRLSSTPGRTATRFACGTTTLFDWQSLGSAHSLRKGDATISRVFLGGLCSGGLQPAFFGWRNKAGTRLRRRGCYLGLLGESGYSPDGVTRSTTHAFLKADMVHAWR